MCQPLRKATLSLIVLAFFVLGCEQAEEAEPITESKRVPAESPPEWAEYLFEHTAGTISSVSEIELRFSRDVIPPERLDEDWGEAIAIQPGIGGRVVADSVRRLRVVPDEPLRSGTHYEVTLRAGALPGIPDEVGDYHFSFQTIVPDFELRLDGLSVDSEDGDILSLGGMLTTADVATELQVRQILSVSYQDDELPIEWQHLSDRRQHGFTITGIDRPEETAVLTVRWDGQALGVDKRGEREIEVPARDVFQVADVSIVQDDRQQIRVRFSERLDPGQNLDGLVQIGDTAINTRISGNMLTIHLDDDLVGDHTLSLSPGIRSRDGVRLEQGEEWPLSFGGTPPKVRFSGSGVILPANTHLELPFEAINAHSVQVTAFRVYQDNIGQFLQYNNLEQSSQLGRVGRHLWRKTIELPSARSNQWERYSLDLSELADQYPGALFRITLSLNRGNAMVVCDSEALDTPVRPEAPYTDWESPEVRESSGWDFAEQWYGQTSGRSTWRDRQDPCKDAYYRWRDNNTTDARNFLASNIGLMAKAGNDGSFVVLATDLRNGDPLPNTRIEVRNFQDQPLKSLTTDAEGIATGKLEATPYYLLAQHDNDYGYLKVNRGSALPTSHLDVGGETVVGGVKGRIYGERGVWRPGDRLHLTFALHDPDNTIPEGHPATLQLITPDGQLFATQTNDDPLNGFYRFDMRTTEDARTGDWTARVVLGDRRFDRAVKIETVRPNRLTIDVQAQQDILKAGEEPAPFTFRSQWLHGADASNLQADLRARFAPVKTRFTRFSGFEFDDPIRRVGSDEVTLWEGKLDEAGKAEFTADIKLASPPPGQLEAYLTSRVFESGGAFSISRQSMPMHAFDRYVGIRMPEGDSARNMLRTDEAHTVLVGTLSAEGDPVDVSDIEIEIFKLDWKWWWDQSAYAVTNFSSRNHRSRITQGKTTTTEGQGEWQFEIKAPQWGRFLIRACDKAGGHCTGEVFYIDWPGWAGEGEGQSGASASVLVLNADKDEYTVGETAILRLPAGLEGRGLLTLEDGSGILSQRWLTFDGSERQSIEIPILQDMAPNVYAAVTHIQPHRNRDNDRPMRLYGMVPLSVKDPATHLSPVIETAELWQPRAEHTVTVSEDDGRPMTYTLAVVDEGLLGLTSFATPSLHADFYQREALGVLTWDLFDQVVGAYGGELERLLAIGGSDSAEADPRKEGERRFPPVVRFMGPFHLAAGESREHSVDMPQYVGAVRVMAVAGNRAAYGSSQSTVTVREPLSTLVTLPRVLGPGEVLNIPVSVFAYDEDIDEAEIRLELGDGLTLVDEPTKTVSFSNGREQIARFRVEVAEQLGMTRITAIAHSGEQESRSDTTIDIRAPATPEIRSVTQEIPPGEAWEHELALHGMAGTNAANLSLSSVPPFGLDHRLNYLVRYPYGCVEQITSAAFPQAYLPGLVDLPPETMAETENNVHTAVERLRRFQRSDGSFSYWPGVNHYQAWSNIWAGHFVVEAHRLGFNVPSQMRSDWLEHARGQAAEWTTGNQSSTLTQAYRLYVLALGNQAQLSAMNRLRESGSLEEPANWMLAAAYAHVGLRDAAEQLLSGRPEVDYDYERPGPTFGSRLRDQGLLLNALSALGRDEAANLLAEQIAAELRSERRFSTQSLGFGMSALARHATGAADQSREGSRLSAEVREDDNEATPITSDRTMARTPLVAEQGRTVTVRNKSERSLWATIAVEGSPPPGEEQPLQGKLGLDVSFSGDDGEPLDWTELRQGTDVVASLTVRNRSGGRLEQLALKHVVPSGWEIANERLDGGDRPDPEYDYLDIRDDRVFTHFGLDDGERRTFRFRFTATYAGHFYAPGIVFEDMYDSSLTSRTAGQWVQVVE